MASHDAGKIRRAGEVHVPALAGTVQEAYESLVGATNQPAAFQDRGDRMSFVTTLNYWNSARGLVAGVLLTTKQRLDDMGEGLVICANDYSASEEANVGEIQAIFDAME